MPLKGWVRGARMRDLTGRGPGESGAPSLGEWFLYYKNTSRYPEPSCYVRRSNRLLFHSRLFSTYCCSPQHLAIRAHYGISLPFMRFAGAWHNPFYANLFLRGEAFAPTPFTLPPCSPHGKADLRPPTWLTPRGSLRLGPPLRGLAALHEAALRRRGDRAGRGGRMGSFGSNKRMCDFALCAAGRTMETG